MGGLKIITVRAIEAIRFKNVMEIDGKTVGEVVG